jgi:hypothetical protein
MVTFIIKYLKEWLRNISTTVDELIIPGYADSFDNEIWCYVMMSDSFLDLLKDNKDAGIHRLTFYYSQTCFWLNKAIIKLHHMSGKVNKIFSTKDDSCVKKK